MARIAIEIPDAQVERVAQAFAFAHGPAAEGEDDVTFIRRRLLEYARGVVASSEARQAAETAQANAETAARAAVRAG